jgi:hypothetical protein
MDHHVVTEKLLLASSGQQVSQAIPNQGLANAIWINAWIESGGTITSGDLDIDVQQSFDLDTWATVSSIYGSLSLAPGSVSFGTDYIGTACIRAPFVRLKFKNTTAIDLLVGAEVRLFQM